jgi:hypothetical protein
MKLHKVSIVVLAWLLAACISPLFWECGGPASCAGEPVPMLGVIVDAETLQVTDVWPGYAAHQAGIQVGDILVSVTPLTAREADEIFFMTDRDRAKVVIRYAWPQQRAEEQERVKEADARRLDGLPTSTPVPAFTRLKVKVDRDGEMMEFELQPYPVVDPPVSPPATPISPLPMPENYDSW